MCVDFSLEFSVVIVATLNNATGDDAACGGMCVVTGCYVVAGLITVTFATL